MNTENLLKLADYLETLPEDYEHFEMSDFMQDGDPTKYAEYALHNGSVAVTTCGAAACAVGHGPSAGFLFNEDELVEGYTYELDRRVNVLKPNWAAYCERVFCCSYGEDEHRWQFMFGGSWSYCDNSPWGAAARIRYCIANPGADYEELAYDKDEIIYSEYRKVSKNVFA